MTCTGPECDRPSASVATRTRNPASHAVPQSPSGTTATPTRRITPRRTSDTPAFTCPRCWQWPTVFVRVEVGKRYLEMGRIHESDPRDEPPVTLATPMQVYAPPHVGFIHPEDER